MQHAPRLQQDIRLIDGKFVQSNAFDGVVAPPPARPDGFIYQPAAVSSSIAGAGSSSRSSHRHEHRTRTDASGAAPSSSSSRQAAAGAASTTSTSSSSRSQRKSRSSTRQPTTKTSSTSRAKRHSRRSRSDRRHSPLPPPPQQQTASSSTSSSNAPAKKASSRKTRKKSNSRSRKKSPKPSSNSGKASLPKAAGRSNGQRQQRNQAYRQPPEIIDSDDDEADFVAGRGRHRPNGKKNGHMDNGHVGYADDYEDEHRDQEPEGEVEYEDYDAHCDERDEHFLANMERVSRVKPQRLRPSDRVSLVNFGFAKVLGTGAYGKVYMVRKLDGIDKGKIYAMKVLTKSTIITKLKTAEHTKTEREVLEKVRKCPFLVELHYAFQSSSKLYLVLDYVSGGELFTHLFHSETFPLHRVRMYIAEIVVAMEQLHMRNIIYRDIKLENILLDADGHIVITDFGLSKQMGTRRRTHSFCGTIEYMAPEVVDASSGHSISVDWWSVGVLTFELLTGASPFASQADGDQQAEISARIISEEPQIPKKMDPEVADFIRKMLAKMPEDRLNGENRDARQIKAHPFFKTINWEKLKAKELEAPFKPKVLDDMDTSNFSQEFTNLEPVDPKVDAIPHHKRLFRGYSFVAQELQKSNYRHLLDDDLDSAGEESYAESEHDDVQEDQVLLPLKVSKAEQAAGDAQRKANERLAEQQAFDAEPVLVPEDSDVEEIDPVDELEFGEVPEPLQRPQEDEVYDVDEERPIDDDSDVEEVPADEMIAHSPMPIDDDDDCVEVMDDQQDSLPQPPPPVTVEDDDDDDCREVLDELEPDTDRSPSAVQNDRPPTKEEVLQHLAKDTVFSIRYDLLSQVPIAFGAFSVCMRCRLRDDVDDAVDFQHMDLAVKITSVNCDASRNEEEILTKCQGHPSILKLYEVMRDDMYTYVITELLEGGDLMSRASVLKNDEIETVFGSVASALQHMHSRYTAHRDVRPANIMFASSDDVDVRLIDFGFAQSTYDESMHQQDFLLEFAAPELIAAGPAPPITVTDACDYWSLGVTLYWLLCRSPPFGVGNEIEPNVMAANYNTECEGWRSAPEHWRAIVESLLTLDVSRRREAFEELCVRLNGARDAPEAVADAGQPIDDECEMVHDEDSTEYCNDDMDLEPSEVYDGDMDAIDRLPPVVKSERRDMWMPTSSSGVRQEAQERSVSLSGDEEKPEEETMSNGDRSPTGSGEPAAQFSDEDEPSARFDEAEDEEELQEQKPIERFSDDGEPEAEYRDEIALDLDYFADENEADEADEANEAIDADEADEADEANEANVQQYDEDDARPESALAMQNVALDIAAGPTSADAEPLVDDSADSNEPTEADLAENAIAYVHDLDDQADASDWVEIDDMDDVEESDGAESPVRRTPQGIEAVTGEDFVGFDARTDVDTSEFRKTILSQLDKLNTYTANRDYLRLQDWLLPMSARIYQHAQDNESTIALRNVQTQFGAAVTLPDDRPATLPAGQRGLRRSRLPDPTPVPATTTANGAKRRVVEQSTRAPPAKRRKLDKARTPRQTVESAAARRPAVPTAGNNFDMKVPPVLNEQIPVLTNGYNGYSALREFNELDAVVLVNAVDDRAETPSGGLMAGRRSGRARTTVNYNENLNEKDFFDRFAKGKRIMKRRPEIS